MTTKLLLAERLMAPSEAADPMMSEVAPLVGMAMELARTPLVVYSSKNTGSPELASVVFVLPTRRTIRLPGWKPGVICA